ncbi:MAG: RHS repeat-associated core domain-containing protein [Pseudomonadota bacterium]
MLCLWKVASGTSTCLGELFTGEQFDPNVGFYYLRARYYGPGNGRFLTMDTWMGRSMDPRTLHKYLYVHADPANGIDPTGYFTMSETSVAIRTLGSALRTGVAVFNSIDRIVDLISLTHSLTTALYRVVSIGPGEIADIAGSFKENANPRFNYAMSESGMADAASTFSRNIGKIARRIYKYKKSQLQEFIRNRKAKLMLYMPTPMPNKLGSPTMPPVPLGISVGVPRNGARQVALQFGKPGAGRMFGVGCTECGAGGSRKPKQWVRMDWHEPHSTTQTDRYWIDGFFHFHIP